GQEEGHRVDGAPADGASMLDVVADRPQRTPKAPLHRGLGEAYLACDLPVRVAAEVRELHHAHVLRRQGAHRVVDRVPHHRAGKVLPGVRSVAAVGQALEEDLLQALVGASHPAPVHRGPPGARHQPGTPTLMDGDRDGLVIEVRHCLLLRYETKTPGAAKAPETRVNSCKAA